MRSALGAAVALGLLLSAAPGHAQVPKDIQEGLKKIGQIVDPACTAKLYRPLMPANDFNTYWPPDAAAAARRRPSSIQASPSPRPVVRAHDKDVVDVFVGDTAQQPARVHLRPRRRRQQDRTAGA